MGVACAVWMLAGACCILSQAAAHQLPGDSQAHFEQQAAQQNCQAAAERTTVTLDALCPMSDRLSSACCDKLAAFESTQCFCVLRPEREAAHPGQDALARMQAAYASCFSEVPTCNELSVDATRQAFQAGAEAADEYGLPLEQFEAQEARKPPLELPAAFLSEESSQPPQQPEDEDTQEGWAANLRSLVQQAVPFKPDFAAGGRKLGLRSGARRTKLQETVAEVQPAMAHAEGSQLQQLSTTMDMNIHVAIANRQPGNTAKLLLMGRGSSLRLSAPNEFMSRDSTAHRCWMVGAMLAVCAGLASLGLAVGRWARQVRPPASFDIPLLGEQGAVDLEVQGQGRQMRLSSLSLSPRPQVFDNPAADARSCQQQAGEE